MNNCVDRSKNRMKHILLHSVCCYRPCCYTIMLLQTSLLHRVDVTTRVSLQGHRYPVLVLHPKSLLYHQVLLHRSCQAVGTIPRNSYWKLQIVSLESGRSKRL